MTDKSANSPAPPPSPLDPFLGTFLRRVDGLPDGYAPVSHGRAIAATLDWSPAFVDALFTSARARGLVEPYRARGTRRRARWCVSARGRGWIAGAVDVPSPAADERAAPS